jgi:hypothetical protein
MEKIQERALRFIYNSSYENLHEKSKLSSLKFRRLQIIGVETFKIIHKKNSPSYLHDLINIKLQNYHFRSQETAVLPRVRATRYGLKSFRYNAAQIWNELPNHCRKETSLGQKFNTNAGSNQLLMPVQCKHLALRSLCFFNFVSSHF